MWLEYLPLYIILEGSDGLGLILVYFTVQIAPQEVVRWTRIGWGAQKVSRRRLIIRLLNPLHADLLPEAGLGPQAGFSNGLSMRGPNTAECVVKTTFWAGFN